MLQTREGHAFLVGDRVRLPADDRLPDEEGTIIAIDGRMLTIELDAQYLEDDDDREPDDGLREAHVDNVIHICPKGRCRTEVTE